MNLFGQYIISKEFNYIESLIIFLKQPGEHDTKTYMKNYENTIFTGIRIAIFYVEVDPSSPS